LNQRPYDCPNPVALPDLGASIHAWADAMPEQRDAYNRKHDQPYANRKFIDAPSRANVVAARERPGQ